MDMAKISSRMAVHLLIAVAEALGHRVELFALNHTTIHNLRADYRLRHSQEVVEDFSDNVHLNSFYYSYHINNPFFHL